MFGKENRTVSVVQQTGGNCNVTHCTQDSKVFLIAECFIGAKLQLYWTSVRSAMFGAHRTRTSASSVHLYALCGRADRPHRGASIRVSLQCQEQEEFVIFGLGRAEFMSSSRRDTLPARCADSKLQRPDTCWGSVTSFKQNACSQLSDRLYFTPHGFVAQKVPTRRRATGHCLLPVTC
jgi:hypothetical protein